MVKNNLVKSAFTLIELIFAIVIISISVISLPLLTQITSKGIESNLIQEAIFIAAAQLNEATTYTWDEHSTNDLNISELAKVVNTTTGGCTVANNRPGNINRSCLSDSTIRPYDAASANGHSINTIAYSTPKSIFIAGATPSDTAYKNNYNSTLIVTRCINNGDCIQFGNEVANENIKQIQYEILDATTGNTLVLLRAYSTNIGELEPQGVLIP